MPLSCFRIVFLAAVLTLLAPTGATRACLNDRDSDALTIESKGLPETLNVISGRFERNPPLFYQMRIRRVQAEIARHPTRLNLYDDVAVAYDRLGQSEEALHWISRKRTQLENTTPTNRAVKEQWYRYYANAGTFRAHRWLRAGAKPQTLPQMVQARSEIARAVQIKPNAHFNREKYQLATMDWIIASRGKKSRNAGPLRVFLAERVKPTETRAAIEGLSGLIVLGNAWKSVDVFGALSEFLLRDKRPKFAYLAFLRCKSLTEAGKVSLAAEPWQKQAAPPAKRFNIEPPNDVYLAEMFHSLTDGAGEWQNERDTYLYSLLEKGQHPDTTANFWKAYTSETNPSLNINWDLESDQTATREQRDRQKMRKQALSGQRNREAIAAIVLVLCAPCAVIAAVTTWEIRRKRQARLPTV